MPDLAQRVQHVRLLLETLNDPYPTPHGALEPDSGPAASRYVPCETCRRTGSVKWRRAWRLCLGCDGVGWRRRTRADSVEWDAYIELPIAEAMQLPVAAPPRRRIEASLTPSEPPYAWEMQRRVYDRYGSYGELRKALSWLALEAPLRYRLVRLVHVDHELLELGRGHRRELELGVVAVTLRMKTVRVPPWLIERSAAAERRESLEGLAAAGLGAGEIARRLGVSKETVRRRLRAVGGRSRLHGNAGVPCGAT